MEYKQLSYMRLFMISCFLISSTLGFSQSRISIGAGLGTTFYRAPVDKGQYYGIFVKPDVDFGITDQFKLRIGKANRTNFIFNAGLHFVASNMKVFARERDEIVPGETYRITTYKLHYKQKSLYAQYEIGASIPVYKKFEKLLLNFASTIVVNQFIFVTERDLDVEEHRTQRQLNSFTGEWVNTFSRENYREDFILNNEYNVLPSLRLAAQALYPIDDRFTLTADLGYSWTPLSILWYDDFRYKNPFDLNVGILYRTGKVKEAEEVPSY